MSVAVPVVARYALRITVTVVWALVLSKLIRMSWSKLKQIWQRLRTKTSTTKK